MNTHPILFSPPMVQSLLNGRKTMTRRLNGLEEINKNPNDWQFEWADYCLKKPWRFTQKSSINVKSVADRSFYQAECKCPYGKTGDILWVRETWKVPNPNGKPNYQYKADWDKYNTGVTFKWKPSIFMPKAACRIFLKITDIRVARLQDISNIDAINEGIEITHDYGDGFYSYKNYNSKETSDWEVPSLSFMTLWQSINGEDSWNSNPWVWVISFEHTEKPENF